MFPVRERRWGGGAAAILFAAFALLFAFAGPAAADLKFPPLTGRVVDDAHVLSPEVTAQLTQKLAALQAKNGRQLVVVTLPSLQGDDIEDYGYQLGRAWGIGQKGQDNGALFILAPNEKKVRVEVGYGLEPVLTDALSSVILQTQVLPRFRQGDIPGGVVAGTDALVQQLGLSDAEAQQQVQEAVRRPAPRRHETVGAIFSLLLVIFVISAFFRGGRRGGGMGWVLPMMFLGGALGGRDRDDDWGGGGGGSDDNFGGGGG
ncbi:MAG: TPM domain-containing protein, partial [Caulobacteraceae bacterium]